LFFVGDEIIIGILLDNFGRQFKLIIARSYHRRVAAAPQEHISEWETDENKQSVQDASRYAPAVPCCHNTNNTRRDTFRQRPTCEHDARAHASSLAGFISDDISVEHLVEHDEDAGKAIEEETQAEDNLAVAVYVGDLIISSISPSVRFSVSDFIIRSRYLYLCSLSPSSK